jgi:hypothetical protein
MENYLEIYSEDSTPHPTVSAPADGAGVNFRDAMLTIYPFVKLHWSDVVFPSFEGAPSPYRVCWAFRNWQFRAGNNIACNAGEQDVAGAEEILSPGGESG